jgi:hypothetical protein
MDLIAKRGGFDTKGYKTDSKTFFVICQASIKCGLTTRKEYSLGRDGMLNIQLPTYEQVMDKDAFHTALNIKGQSINDYKPFWHWLPVTQYFTSAFINNLYRKLAVYGVEMLDGKLYSTLNFETLWINPKTYNDVELDKQHWVWE